LQHFIPFAAAKTRRVAGKAAVSWAALAAFSLADFAEPAERFRISVLRPAELLKKVRP
jgi:hypothetical protein